MNESEGSRGQFGPGGDSGDEIIGRLAEWAVDHVEVEANFEGLPSLLVGDPQVLVDAPRTTEQLLGMSTGMLDLSSGKGFVLASPGGERDGPWVWVLASDDGPITSIAISAELESPERGTRQELGYVDVPSGRLAIGAPESIAVWGPHVDARGMAEFRVSDDVQGALRLGYIVVAHLPVPGRCRVLASMGQQTGRIATIDIELPKASWLPEPAPIMGE